MAVYTGKVVIVTGASQGIGKALSLALAPQRPRLVLAARDTEALARVARDCEALGAEALVAGCDVSDEAACRALAAAAVERFQAIDVLVIAPYFVQSEIRKRSPGPDGHTVPASPLKEAELMSAEECARLIVGAMEKRKRILVMTLKGKLGRWAGLAFPSLVDHLAAEAVRKGR